jgi:hypothetical protein
LAANANSMSAFLHQTRRAWLISKQVVLWHPFAPNNNGS